MDPAVIHTPATCEWGKEGLPLCLIGDSGTGKSHLLSALGTEASMAGYRASGTFRTRGDRTLPELGFLEHVPV